MDPRTSNSQPAPPPQRDSELFSSRSPQPAPRSPLPWLLAACAIIVIAGAFILSTRHKAVPAPHVARAVDPYAAHVTFSNLVMSESTSISGGKSTFIDGEVRNAGTETLTSATVQVLFANDEALPPQVETTPLTLIRTREPYVDTQPVSAAPLAPGDARPFRLIFEDVATNWNQQLPEVRLVQASLR